MDNENIETYKSLPEGTGALLKMKDGETVEIVSHFNDTFFSGIYESRRYDHHEYHFKYTDIEDILVYG